MGEGTCKAKNCSAPIYVKGMCRPHYRRAAKYGDPLHVKQPKRCSVEGCKRPYKASGYCEMHYGRMQRTGQAGPAGRVRLDSRAVCSIEGCEDLASAKTFCPKHYQRFVRLGDPLAVPPRAHPEGPIRPCKWCGTEFDRRSGGRHLFCSEKCARTVALLVSYIGRYSLTVDGYRALWVAQNGQCAICGADPNGRSDMLHVDHDHGCCPKSKSCGRCIRGLLCELCNRALGMFGDDPARLRRAVAYVERHRVGT